MKRSIRTRSNVILDLMKTEQQKVQFNTVSLLFIYVFLTKFGRTAAKRMLTLYTIEMVQDKLRGQSPHGPNG